MSEDTEDTVANPKWLERPGPIHPLSAHTHPTLHYARDIAPGWALLQYRTMSPVVSVESQDGHVLVTFEDGSTDVWGATDDDRVHAETADEREARLAEEQRIAEEAQRQAEAVTPITGPGGSGSGAVKITGTA